MANQPDIIPSVWAANNTSTETIPATTTVVGKASWDQGFPIETGKPLSQGGVPPRYGDFNGVLNALSQFAVFAQSGGQYAWANSIDYGVGSIVRGTDGNLYRATQESGPTTAAVNPVGDTTGKWAKIVSQSDIDALLTDVSTAMSTASDAASNASAAQSAVTTLDANVVKLSGNQTVSGEKTFANTIISTKSPSLRVDIPSGSTYRDVVRVNDSSGVRVGIVRGQVNASNVRSIGLSVIDANDVAKTGIYVSTDTEGKTYATAPATPTGSTGNEIITANYFNNTVVNLTGDQIVGGVKTFSSTIAGSINGNAATATTAAKLGTTTVGGANKPVYLSSGTATVCNTMVSTTGNQTISGTKTFSSTIVGDITGNAATATTATNATQLGGVAAASYQLIDTKAWSNAVDYAVGAVVKGSDGNVYEALQASGPSSTVINPVGDATITWAKADFYNLQNWVNFGTYALTPVQDATYTLTASQGMCYDTKRSRFVVAMFSPGEANQELHALNPSNMSIVKAAAHTDLGHANSMTYYPGTDEIVCATGISDKVDGSDKKRLVVIDAATLTTKRFIYTTYNTERHISYDPVKGVFVFALQSSSWQFERFWKYEPVVTNSTLTGLTLIGSYFDVPLPKTGMHNNGLGCYNGIAFVGGSYWSIIDYENKRLIYTAPSSQTTAEFEDFVYVDGSWYCNTNVAFTIFKFDPLMKSPNSMDRYKLLLDSVLDGDLKVITGSIIHAGTSNIGALRFYGCRNGLSDGGQLFICGNGFGGTTDRGGVRLMASSPDGTQNCGVQVRVIETGTPTTYVKTFKPWITETVSLGNASGKWSEVFAVQGSINTSDERLKNNIVSIPDAVLDAWGEVGWYQFQMKDAMEKKGENARLHSGVIAQRIASVFQSHGLDASRYGLFCHDEWDAEYNEQDDGTSVLAIPAGDAYAIRYTEALAMEAAYQRRRSDRAEARITALESRLDEMEAAIASLISPVGDETYGPFTEQDAEQKGEE